MTMQPPKIGNTWEPPSPVDHWCVVVGDFYHQLQATSLDGGWNYYDNDRIDIVGGGWALYEVGEPRFNDVAITSAGKLHHLPYHPSRFAPVLIFLLFRRASHE